MTLFYLLMAHLVGDFILQKDKLIQYKNPSNRAPRFAGVVRKDWWVYFMSAHSATHSLLVYMVTGNALIGMLEFILHFAIDLGKCLGMYGVQADQFAHFLTKLLYVYLLSTGI